MKQRKNSTRIMSMLLAVLLIIAMPFSVSAQSLNKPDHLDFSSVEEFNETFSGGNTGIEPYSFTRDYNLSLISSGYKCVMSDENWFAENLVGVYFVSSKGPASASVYVVDSDDEKTGPYDVKLGSATAFYIAPGPFAIYAKNTSGYNGEVTFRVSLTSTYT